MTATTSKLGEDMQDAQIEAVANSLRQAWQLGQTYWQQADSESWKQQDKSNETRLKFEALMDETRRLLARQPAAIGKQEVAMRDRARRFLSEFKRQTCLAMSDYMQEVMLNLFLQYATQPDKQASKPTVPDRDAALAKWAREVQETRLAVTDLMRSAYRDGWDDAIAFSSADSDKEKSNTCAGCEGKPSVTNSPCAVCGKTAAQSHFGSPPPRETVMLTKLKPCPFCGKHPELNEFAAWCSYGHPLVHMSHETWNFRAALTTAQAEPAQPALTDDARDALIRDVAAQKPEKPDHWSSCGQCGHNIERAQDLLDAAQSASGDTQ